MPKIYSLSISDRQVQNPSPARRRGVLATAALPACQTTHSAARTPIDCIATRQSPSSSPLLGPNRPSSDRRPGTQDPPQHRSTTWSPPARPYLRLLQAPPRSPHRSRSATGPRSPAASTGPRSTPLARSRAEHGGDPPHTRPPGARRQLSSFAVGQTERCKGLQRRVSPPRRRVWENWSPCFDRALGLRPPASAAQQSADSGAAVGRSACTSRSILARREGEVGY